MSDCLFCKIIAGEIPSSKVYEDELCYAFHDIDRSSTTSLYCGTSVAVENSIITSSRAE